VALRGMFTATARLSRGAEGGRFVPSSPHWLAPTRPRDSIRSTRTAVAQSLARASSLRGSCNHVWPFCSLKSVLQRTRDPTNDDGLESLLELRSRVGRQYNCREPTGGISKLHASTIRQQGARLRKRDRESYISIERNPVYKDDSPRLSFSMAGQLVAKLRRALLTRRS